MGYNAMGILCTQLLAVINYANAPLPFVVTAFPVVSNLAANHIPWDLKFASMIPNVVGFCVMTLSWFPFDTFMRVIELSTGV